MTHTSEMFRPRLARRRRVGGIFAVGCAAMVVLAIVVLAVLLLSLAQQGWQWLSLDFLNRFPSRLYPERAGVKSALFGTLWLIGITAVVAVPIGIGAAIYLHEYAHKNRATRFIELNIANLAGVPSIVYGILGLAVFIRLFDLGRSVVAGGLTLSLLILPVVIIASREALAAVPDSIRQAAFGLGATRWQAIRSHVLPAALPGMMTGVILALSRAIGEAAPLIMIGALTFIAFVPEGPMDDFTAMPIQIYNWCDEPDAIFRELAGAGILVLLGMLLPMNAVAVGIRMWHQRRRAC